MDPLFFPPALVLRSFCTPSSAPRPDCLVQNSQSTTPLISTAPLANRVTPTDLPPWRPAPWRLLKLADFRRIRASFPCGRMTSALHPPAHQSESLPGRESPPPAHVPP